ncbi:methyltransferase type 11 [Planomonospora parontospora subsp. parontospora]|uniref:Methyltransferase type 11 n=2 Tax=Planomonospora parontospora TaxID=58119 RepID=A0AA37BLM5_9ACTN|nr:class I SAM-dependent methyltransferase [Planomonospora parontospora]GGK90048.1 methyltransferase type 11 [Planomonospora parontospora]GII11690.1 methyltransferase type 11 [Planomonospora parontospora subsp. parontospora]
MNFLTDNPALYEAQFPDPEHRAARFLDEQVRRFGGGRSLLDVGCGTGRDAGHLAGLGYDATGIDVSEAMLAYAREHHPKATFARGDMRDFALDRRFDVVTCLDSAMLYCHTNADLAAFLGRCRAHLRPGGLLIAEMRNGAHFLTHPVPEPFTRTVTYAGVVYTSRTELRLDHAAQLLRRRRRWRWPGGEPLEQHSAWRLLFPQELAYFLTVAGFEVLDLFDRPGPRAEPHDGPPLSADRLHLIARLAKDPHHA